jgi:hypothetical protein
MVPIQNLLVQTASENPRTGKQSIKKYISKQQQDYERLHYNPAMTYTQWIWQQQMHQWGAWEEQQYQWPPYYPQWLLERLRTTTFD